MKTHSRVYKRLRLWKFMARHPEGVNRLQIAEYFGWGRLGAISQLLGRMRRDGSARRVGSIRFPTWFATKQPPGDLRGTNASSLKQLEPGQSINRWLPALMAAHASLGQDPKKLLKARKPVLVRPKPGIELERCWTFTKSGGKVSANVPQYVTQATSRVCEDEEAA